jgi:PAS domain-containing protein
MIDRIPAMVWSCLPDGTPEFLNQCWLDYTGQSIEKALDWGWEGAIHPEDLGNVMDTWQRLLSSGEPGVGRSRVSHWCAAAFRLPPSWSFLHQGKRQLSR